MRGGGQERVFPLGYCNLEAPDGPQYSDGTSDKGTATSRSHSGKRPEPSTRYL